MVHMRVVQSATRNGILWGALLLAPVWSAAQGTAQYYHVENGRVDDGTYTGWQIFQENCAACHGADATGTSHAPDLTERISRLSYQQFRLKVLNRYFITMPLRDATSENSDAVRSAFEETIQQQQEHNAAHVKMPPWRHNPDVRKHLRDLYAYLTARADGVLGPGIPRRLNH